MVSLYSLPEWSLVGPVRVLAALLACRCQSNVSERFSCCQLQKSRSKLQAKVPVAAEDKAEAREDG